MNEPPLSEAFLASVLDTILPGERKTPAGASALPCASEAGIALRRDDRRHEAVLRLIAGHAGGEERFIAATPGERATILDAVERKSFEAFRALVSSALQDYYEAPAILAVLGWRAGGAQPQGHELREGDTRMLRRLDKVKARAPFWRR